MPGIFPRNKVLSAMARIKKNTRRKFNLSGDPFVVTGMVTVLIGGIIAALHPAIPSNLTLLLCRVDKPSARFCYNAPVTRP
jgi:hypothetical protein